MQRMLCNLIAVANTNLYDLLPCISSLEADAFTSKNTTPVAEYNNEHRRKMNIKCIIIMQAHVVSTIIYGHFRRMITWPS
jgi:hypothetical protein